MSNQQIIQSNAMPEQVLTMLALKYNNNKHNHKQHLLKPEVLKEK